MTDMEKNAAAIQVAPATTTTTDTSAAGRERRLSCSSVDSLKKGRSGGDGRCDGTRQDVLLSREDEDDRGAPAAPPRRPGKVGRVLLPAGAVVILGWWVASTVLPATRHRWVVQTLWAWFFVLVIVFRFVPIAPATRPVRRVWERGVAQSVAALPPRARLALLWLAAVGVTFGSAFGFARPEGTALADRVISLAGVYFFQLCIYALSRDRAAIDWIRVPVSIILQQVLALLVLKTSAGHDVVAWFSTAVADFCTCAVQASALIFDPATAGKNWFFVTALGVIIFVAAFVQMLYFFNWMQWFTKQFAWLGHTVFGASGAETFVALWSPWFGQVNSALLVGPYVAGMTDAELHTVMAVSMSSISSLMISTYAKIPTRNLLAQSAIVIPASIVNAKMAFPEVAHPVDAAVHSDDSTHAEGAVKLGAGVAAKRADRTAAAGPDAAPVVPLTRTRESTCAGRKRINLRKAVDLMDCLSDGAGVGLRVAGFVLANFFALLGLLLFVDGTLIWIFRGFGVPELDLHQVIAALLYPFVFFLGVPRGEIFAVAYVLAGKLLISSDFAYAAVAAGVSAAPGSRGVPFGVRTLAVMGVSVGNVASLASLGIQVGVMTALTPASRKRAICLGGIPALLVALFTSMQGAAIAANVL